MSFNLLSSAARKGHHQRLILKYEGPPKQPCSLAGDFRNLDTHRKDGNPEPGYSETSPKAASYSRLGSALPVAYRQFGMSTFGLVTRLW